MRNLIPAVPRHRWYLPSLAATAGLAFFILGYGAILLTREGLSVAIIWPATPLTACILLRFCRTQRDDTAVLAAVFLAGLIANTLGGSPPLLTASFSLINVLEAWLGATLARRFAPNRFFTFQSGLRFGAIAGLLPPIAGASLAALMTYLSGSPDVFASGRNWYLADTMGFFTVAPLMMTLSRREIAKLNLAHRLPEASATFATLLVVTLAVTCQSSEPPLFAVIPLMLLATYSFRLPGAGTAIVMVGLISVVCAHLGFGGMNLLSVSQAAARNQILQLFIAVCSVMCVAGAALLNQRDLHMAIIDRRRQRAVHASQFKSQLLAHVSHEVRTPLSAIIGFSSMLESGALPSDRAGEFAQIIAHNGELLLRLHDDLLDWSHADAGALTISRQSVPVARALSTLAERVDIFTGGYKHPLVIGRIDQSLNVMADPLRLAQILNNLISNARKYGADAPVIVQAHKLNEYFGRIEIRNEGPGIAPEHRAAIFKPFAQIRPGRTDVPGTGLGLSIAKMLAELQGGRLDFESVPGGQTRFWVDLPLAA